MRIIITGGAGFIGSNLANSLAKSNEVFVLDDLSFGQKSNLDGNSELIICDVRNIPDYLYKLDPDYIIHLAAKSSAPMFYEEPMKGADVNVNGFIRIMEFAKDAGVKKVVYASTSSLYSRTKPPHKEDIELIPGSFYELSKLANEHTARIYDELHGVKSVGLRFFSVYGPNELHKKQYANIATQFLWLMRKNQRPTIYGDGKQTRDFVYVTDIMDGITRAMKSNFNGILNLGSGKSYSFNDVVGLLNGVLKKNIKAKHANNPIKNYVEHTHSDISLAKKKIGFNPKVDLKEGLQLLAEHYK